MATIVHLANFYGPRSGGLRTSVRALARGYVHAGHVVHVIVPSARRATVVEDGITTHEVPGCRLPRSGGYRAILRRPAVIDLVACLDPDRVELSDRTTLLPVADWARAHGVPSVMIAHERIDGVVAAFAPGLPARRIADWLNAGAAERVDHIVCTTAFAAEEFDRIGRLTTRIPLGVDLDAFHPSHRSQDWRASVSAGPIALLCSRLSREKRPGFVLDIARHARSVGAVVRVVVAGTGPQERAIARDADRLGVRMLGYVTDRRRLATVLASADVLLAPGPIETFGLSALESLASGTPVVANRSSAVGEIIDGSSGCTADLDPTAWVAAIEQLTSRPRSHTARDARRRAEQFPWSRTVDLMLDLHGLRAPRSGLAAA
jgi:alpha-1,6-mannosyltransferase